MSKEKYEHYNLIDLDAPARPHKEIIDEVAATIGLAPELVDACVQSYLDTCKREVLSRGRLVVPGFVSFSSVPYPDPPVAFKEDVGQWIKPPPSTQLKYSVSKMIRSGYRWARRYEETRHFGIPLDKWWEPFVVPEEEVEIYRALRREKWEAENKRTATPPSDYR